MQTQTHNWLDSAHFKQKSVHSLKIAAVFKWEIRRNKHHSQRSICLMNEEKKRMNEWMNEWIRYNDSNFCKFRLQIPTTFESRDLCLCHSWRHFCGRSLSLILFRNFARFGSRFCHRICNSELQFACSCFVVFSHEIACLRENTNKSVSSLKM